MIEAMKEPVDEGYYFATPVNGGRRKIVQAIKEKRGFAEVMFIQVVGVTDRTWTTEFTEYAPAVDSLEPRT